MMKNKASIVESLERVLADLGPEDPMDIARRPLAWTKSDAGSSLLKTFEDDDSLGIFDRHMQMLGGQWCAVYYKDLGGWLIDRASEVGATQAVTEVESYLNSEDFEAHHILVLSGLHIRDRVDLAGGVRLIPIRQAPNQRLRAALVDSWQSTVPTPPFLALLVRSFRHARSHLPQGTKLQADSAPTLPVELRQSLLDAHLCLTLSRSGGLGTQPMVSTTVAADSVPIVVQPLAWAIHTFGTFQMEVPLEDDEARAARSIHESFVALDSRTQDQLRIPMIKLSECMASSSRVQSGVSLRTALESLFLDAKPEGELQYRLGIRAAIFAEDELSNRKETQQKMKKVYTLCSAAVHSGRISERPQDQEILNWARQLVCEVLRKIISSGHGVPDWTATELTGAIVWPGT